MASSLEQQRLENQRRNRELLLQLGLEAPIVPAAPPTRSPTKKKAPAPRKSAPAKRRISQVDTDGEDSPAKAARVVETESPSGVRRSSRHSNKPRVSYTDEIISRTNDPPPLVSKPRRARDDDEDVEGMDLKKEGRAENVGNRLGTRIHNPKTYGSIPGIEVGTWWETRAQCSTDAIHAPFVAGISAGSQGAFSVALSGGYEDDVDLGHAFTYTGSGGRDLKGTPGNRKNLRTAPQSSHQDWDNPFNAALKKSAETKKPVRVIRGYKLHSEWAPATGYRYDGLYTVEKAWMEPGLNPGRYKVCKFALKRMDGQPPLPRRAEGAAAAEDSENEDVESEQEGDEDGEPADDEAKMDVDDKLAIGDVQEEPKVAATTVEDDDKSAMEVDDKTIVSAAQAIANEGEVSTVVDDKTAADSGSSTADDQAATPVAAEVNAKKADEKPNAEPQDVPVPDAEGQGTVAVSPADELVAAKADATVAEVVMPEADTTVVPMVPEAPTAEVAVVA